MSHKQNRARCVAVKCEEVGTLTYKDGRGKVIITQRLILHTECAKASDLGKVHRAAKKLIQLTSKDLLARSEQQPEKEQPHAR